VHVARGDGLSGASPREMGKVRELAGSIGATVHVVVGEDVSSALLDFARETNATQLVLGSSRRNRWASIFSEGIGAATIKNSGKIDVHMVSHEAANRGSAFTAIPPRTRQVVSWLAAVILPLAILAITLKLDPTLDVGGKSAIFFAGVISVALFGGVAPAVLSGLLSGAMLVYFHTEPRHSFAVKSLSNALTIMILLGIAMAIAVLVDAAASRVREARRASQEAELLSLFAASVLRGADLSALLERVREAYSQRSVCLVREVDGRLIPVAGVGTESCVTVDAADTAVKVGDDEFWMLMTGRGLTGRDRRVLSVVATQAAGLVKRGELAHEADKVKSLAEADELRRLLLSALGHDLRTPLTAAKAAVSSLRAEDVWFSPEDTSELLATVEESVDQLTLLVANLLDSSRLAAGVVRPELTEVYLEEVVQRALVGIGGRSTINGRASIDRVKVEVGGTIAMGDAGLLERVLSNVIDNALHYAPASIVRVNAGQVGPRVLINIVDEGPGVSKGAAEQMFQPFQRLGDFDTTTGLGLGLSVAKGFVEAMDGTITACDTPGGGLTILVDLAAPLQERRAKGSEAEERRR
jgi:two-component system sensor histidine kinase KdpD